MSDISNYVNREVRYVVPNSHSATVTVYSHNLYEDHRVQAARLLDFSRSGAKLTISEEVSEQSFVRLALAVEELGLQFHVAGEVCWCKPGKDGDWIFGCSLNPEIPDAIFDRLTSSGLRDRRSDARCEDSLHQCLRQHQDGDSTPIILHNYSPGGFCVVSESPGDVGDHFLLQLHEAPDDVIVGKTQWQLNVGRANVVGCSFIDSSDYEQLESFVACKKQQ